MFIWAKLTENIVYSQYYSKNDNKIIMEDWREKLGAAFGAELEQLEAEKAAEEPVAQQPASAAEQQGKAWVNIVLDKHGRKGKVVTLVTDLLCDDNTLQQLASELKAHCGVGGSARCGEVLLQGDKRDKVLALLKAKGMKARII